MKISASQVLLSRFRRCRRILLSLIGKEICQGVQLRIPTERYGSEYGGWTVAAGTLNRNSVIYSAGVGEDVSFDLALINTYGVTVHAFDPTPRSIEWVGKQNLPEQFVLHPIGLADFDGLADFHPPPKPNFVSYSIFPSSSSQASAAQKQIQCAVRRVSTIMAQLGHVSIDVLKIDIEGAEYGVIEDILNQKICIRQLLVEFHHRFPGVGIRKTKNAIASLDAAGYRIFFVSDTGEEYSFLKVSA